MPSRRGFAKLTTDDGAEDSDGTEIIEDDASSPGADRGAFGEMFALAQSVGAEDAEVEEAASAVQDTRRAVRNLRLPVAPLCRVKRVDS